MAVTDWKKSENPYHVEKNHAGQNLDQKDVDAMQKIMDLLK